MGIDYQYQWEKENRHKDYEFFCQLCGADISISYHSLYKYSVAPCKRCIDKAHDDGFNEGADFGRGIEPEQKEDAPSQVQQAMKSNLLSIKTEVKSYTSDLKD